MNLWTPPSVVRGLTTRTVITLCGVAVTTVLAGVLRYASGAPAILAFVVAAIALAGLAWIVSFATEQVGRSFGPAVTGVMQSTLGNLPEFFVVIFALNAGQKVVAETAILGSILVNALLVLGLVIIAGARKAEDGVMRFGKRLPNDTATLLLVSSFIIVLLGIANSSHDPASHHTKTISIVGAIALLLVYGVWLRGYLGSDRRPKEEAETETGARRPDRHQRRPPRRGRHGVRVRLGLVRPRAPADDRQAAHE